MGPPPPASGGTAGPETAPAAGAAPRPWRAQCGPGPMTLHLVTLHLVTMSSRYPLRNRRRATGPSRHGRWTGRARRDCRVAAGPASVCDARAPALNRRPSGPPQAQGVRVLRHRRPSRRYHDVDSPGSDRRSAVGPSAPGRPATRMISRLSQTQQPPAARPPSLQVPSHESLRPSHGSLRSYYDILVTASQPESLMILAGSLMISTQGPVMPVPGRTSLY